MSIKYDPEHQAKAVRLVWSTAMTIRVEWAAITAISGRLGMNAETLRKWVRQAAGRRRCRRDGVSSEDAAESRA